MTTPRNNGMQAMLVRSAKDRIKFILRQVAQGKITKEEAIKRLAAVKAGIRPDTQEFISKRF
jgi:hypothetical protein